MLDTVNDCLVEIGKLSVMGITTNLLLLKFSDNIFFSQAVNVAKISLIVAKKVYGIDLWCFQGLLGNKTLVPFQLLTKGCTNSEIFVLYLR